MPIRCFWKQLSRCQLFLVVAYCCIFAQTAATDSKSVTGVAGNRAELPCPLHQTGDSAILALWYKQGRRLPVYSFDARHPEGEHNPDPNVLDGRATFITNEDPAILLLSPVKPQDDGIYTCRVDYLKLPTHNTVVNFTVIEPPENMTIYDSTGKRVISKSSPINEGSPLFLSCIVFGGTPPVEVTWFTDGRFVEGVTTSPGINQVRNDLKITEVTRSYHEKIFSCSAKNNDVEDPLRKEIKIDMNLRPLSVTINLPSMPLEAEGTYNFECESNGSKPPSTIEWFLENRKIDVLQTNVRSAPGEVTIGTATLNLKVSDHGKTLKCEASNPEIAGSSIAQSTKLNIHYLPIVYLKLGQSMVPSEIKQGEDLYFECKVDSNPRAHKISWFKDGIEILEDKKARAKVIEDSLVLQKVHRNSSGNYTCMAINTLGNTTSNPVKLDIMFSPVCEMNQQPKMIAVGRGEKVNITCRVASNPFTAMFHWQLNGSERIYNFQGETARTGHLVSHFNFMGTLDKDYGSLHCWANNSIGTQKEHCLFNIIPAGPPSAPEDCEILNHTAENIEVACSKGFDGGMEQTFLAEVYDEGGSFHLNASSEAPVFSVDSLRPDTTYVIRVSAFNEKGRSPLVSLTAFTHKVAEKRMGESESLFYSPLIVVLIPTLGGFVFIIVILFFVTRWRRNISTASSLLRESPQPPSIETKTEVPTTIIKDTLTVPPDTKIAGGSESQLKGPQVAEKPKVKPKKKVLVVENGKIERPGISSTSPDSQSSREALITRTRDGSFIASKSGFYNSLDNSPTSTSVPLGYHNSPSHSPTFAPRYVPEPPPITRPHFQRPYQRTLPPPPYSPPRAINLPPLIEEYTPSQHHYSTLPRRRGFERDSYGKEASHDFDTNFSASVEDRYHLVPEWKGNPKYIIRTRDRESDDESFV